MFKIDYPFRKEILACGTQEKIGFCITKKNCAYIFNSLGLDEHCALEDYQREIERLKKELKVRPKIVAHDLNPEYNSTKYALGLGQKSKTLSCFGVQHHQAHIASCLGENQIKDRVIGVVFDDGGWGDDGHIWGGEFFVGDAAGFKRIAHLKYIANTSSMGKLFDIVSKLIGLHNKKEGCVGHGVSELERIVNRSSHVATKFYQFTVKREKDKFLICPEPILQNIVADLKKNISKAIISAAFHNTIIEIARTTCHKIVQKEKVKTVILTGVVFQNRLLLNRLKDLLTSDGFTVITHRHFSCNDSSICFGQAILADAQS